MSLLLAFLACGASDTGDSADTGTLPTWTPETAPSALTGELFVSRLGPDDYYDHWRYEIALLGPAECEMDGCAWAIGIGGNMAWDAGEGWRVSGCDYEADANYLPTVHAEPAFGFTHNNCDIKLDENLVAILWTSALEATLANVEPGTEFGCFYDSHADICEISGWIEVTP